MSGNYGDGKVSGSTTAELWKKAPDDSESEPRPLKITYSIENADEDEEVDETVFEDPEAAERPRLLVPLQSVLGLKALCEREFIRTEAVTEMLNQCRTAYYKELLYLREQLILAAEPEKQIMLGVVQNYEVYFFNPPAYVDDDLKEYMLNCSRWTHKKLIEENYELQMKLSGAGQKDVFDNADFCLKGLLRRHGTYKLFKTFHSVVSNAKDLFDPEDMKRRQEKGLKPIDELQTAISELFPNLRSREDNTGALLSEIDELQRSLMEAKTELARLKGLLESERNRSDELAKKCDDQERLLQEPKVAPMVDNSRVEELTEMQEKMQQEVDAQAERMKKMIQDLAAGKSYELGRSRKDASKVFPKLDEAIADLDKLFAKIVNDSPQVVTEKVSDGDSLARAQKEIQQLKQELASLKAKLAAAEQREQDALAKLKDASSGKKPAPEKPKMPESPTNQGIPIGDVEELKKQLERKIAKVAELELELDQAKKDLRSAQRTIDEKDLLLQEKARKDADKAKHMAELMEKLRKSEEQEEKLAGKLYKAEEKIKQLKEQIRELKNQLGMPQEQSEEEVEEEVDTSTVFMSRYYLRAKNSGKPRWMLLSEDAKYKSQKKNQDETKQVMGPGGVPLPGGQVGGWTSAHHQPQEASRAFNFLRKAPGSNSKASQVRLQYSFTQASSLADPGPDASPTAGSHSSAFSRMNTFHGGPMQDTSPLSPGHVDQRLQHANSMPFQMGGPGVASPGGALGGFQQGGFGSFSRQSTSNSFVPNGPNGPGVFVPRNNTPPQAHPIYSAGGGAVFNNASWRSGQAPSTGPAFTSTMSGGSMMSNPFRPDMGMHGMQSPSGMRLGTPPTGHPGLTNFMAGTTIPRDVGPAAPALAPTLTATASQSVALGGESVTNSLSLAGFSQTIAKLSPSASPGSTKPSDEEGPTSSAGLPLTLSESETTSRMLQHSVSSMSMSPSSSRMAHVSLAMVDPMSPQERPMLQLIPQRQDLPSMDFSEVVSPFRSGSLRQSASWSAFPSSWALREDLGEGSGQTVPNVVTLTMANGAHSDAAASPSDVDISSDRVPSKGEGSKSQVLKPLHQARTMPIDIDFATASAPVSKTAFSSKDGTGSGALPTQGDAVDLLIEHAKSQPLSSVRPEASSFVSWVAPRSNGPKPLTNASLPLTNSFKGKSRAVRSSSNLEGPVQYVQADSLPRLPGGKVRKAAQPPSWLTPL